MTAPLFEAEAKGVNVYSNPPNISTILHNLPGFLK